MGRDRASMRDVARAANVSVTAVSLVVRNKPGVAPETRERVWGAIEELGYVWSSTAKDKANYAVGLLIEKDSVPVILDIFYGAVIGGFQAEAQRLGYHVLLHMFDRRVDSLDGLRLGVTDQVRGLVIANDGDITPEMVRRLEAVRLPIVLIESYLSDQQLPCILGDNFVAGYTVMQHLINLGHRSIAILRGPSKYSSLVDRLRGCLAGAAEAGLLVPPEWMPQPVSGHPKKGYVQMQEILRLPQKPTAVIAISDKTAFGAMEAIKEAGMRIPHDIALASIDDVVESAYTQPPLTTVRIPKYEMGVLAMQKLHRLITGEVEVPVKSIVYGQLIVRESCGARSGARSKEGGRRLEVG